MKKLAGIAGICILATVLLVAGAGLYINGHLEEIARKMTGMDIRFAGLHVGFSPVPNIVISKVALNKDGSTVTVPELTLYPDFGRILTGRIDVKKAVLTEPVVIAGGWGKGSHHSSPTDSESTGFSMSAVPDGLVVVDRGKLFIQANAKESLPISLTAQAEKTGPHLSIALEHASIDEIGLELAGEVVIDSLSPLKITIRTDEGTFNPTAVRDFLVNFGYLSDEQSQTIPGIERVDSKGLEIHIDAASDKIDLKAEMLNLDRVSFKDAVVTLSGGGFAVGCSRGVIHAESLYNWLQQTPATHQTLTTLLEQAGVKALAPEGEIAISSLSLRGKPPETEGGQVFDAMEGAADVDIERLVLRLTAENGREQNLTIGKLDARITIKEGKPTVRVNQLSFSSSEGGTGTLSGSIPLSSNLKETTLVAAIDGFKVFDTALDFHLNKAEAARATFDLALNTPSIQVFADGLFTLPDSGKTDLETRINTLRIISGNEPGAKKGAADGSGAFERPFDLDLFLNNKRSAKAFVKTLQFDAFTSLKDVDLRLEPASDRAVVYGSGRVCGVDLSLGAVGFPPNRLVTTVEAKGTDVDLTSLIACFSDELPVYLTGRLYFLGNFAADGNNLRALLEGAEGDMTMIVTEATVRRISGLDPRLGFFLDILKTARIGYEKDAVAVDRGVVNATLKNGRLDVDQFSITGPLFTAWGAGDFTIKDGRLKLSGGVKTTLGITNRLNIDRILEKGGT